MIAEALFAPEQRLNATRERRSKSRILETPRRALVGFFLSERLKSQLSLLLSLNVAFDAYSQLRGLIDGRVRLPSGSEVRVMRIGPLIRQLELS